MSNIKRKLFRTNNKQMKKLMKELQQITIEELDNIEKNCQIGILKKGEKF